MKGKFDDSDLSVEELALRGRWRELVRHNGDAQKKVARALGMSESAVSRRCTGEDLPSDEEILRLCLHRQLNPKEEEELLNLLAQARKARARRESQAAEYPPSKWRELLENRRLVTLTVILIVVVASGAAWAAISSRSSSSASPTASSGSAGATEIRKGPESSAGALAWVEAPVDGSMVGQAKQMADTIGLWSKPSQSCDLPALSPCIPGSTQVGKVTLPAAVRALCVMDGQMLRNGAPGSPGYYEDNRWLRTAPSAAVEGTGYLSNVWFLRDRLPPNLTRCPR